MDVTAASKRSWAQIVQGEETAACTPADDNFAEEVPPMADPKPMKPGTRGSRQSWCRGEFLMLAGHYGWIMSLDSIDHPDAGKHGGDIYVAKRDLGRKAFKKGDIVGFYLYADDKGLGAEACILIQEAAESDTDDDDGWVGNWSKGWAEKKTGGWAGGWDDWDYAAQEHEAWQSNEHNKTTHGMNPYVNEFIPLIPVVPVARTMDPHVAEFVSTAVGLNPCATEFVPAVNPAPAEREDAISSFNPAYLSDESSDDELSPAPHKVTDSVSGGSTSAGEELGAMSADSGSDVDAEPMPAPMPFRPPPGLTLPPWRKGTQVWGRSAIPEEDTPSQPFDKDQSMPPWRRHAKKAGAESAGPVAELTQA